MGKKIVCFCQDLTESDLIRAIEEGYDHIDVCPECIETFRRKNRSID
jgi:hypothetical protein